MTSLIAQLATLIVGVLSVFFSKSGEKSKVTGVGYAILVLILISGGIGILQGFRSKDEKRQLVAKIQEANSEIAGLRSLMTVTRVKDANAFTRVRLIFRGQQWADWPKGFIGPIPIFVPGVKEVRFRFEIQGIFSSEFAFENNDGDLSAYEGDKRFDFKCTAYECPMGPLTEHWYVDALNGFQSHVVFLPLQDGIIRPDGEKLLSSLLNGAAIGHVEITHEKGIDGRIYARTIFENFEIILKIYGPRSSQNRCSPVIIVHPRIVPLGQDVTSKLIILPEKAVHYDPCEVPPI